MAEIKGLINAKGKGGGGTATPTKIFIADEDYITITQDDLGSWSFPSSEIEDIEFLTPQSEDYPTESDFADGDLLYVYSEEVVEEDGDPVEIKKTLKEIYEVRYIEDNSVVLQKRILIPQSSGGKQLYQHNIRLWNEGTRYVDNVYVDPIINDNPNEMDFADLLSFLVAKGYDYDSSITKWYLQNFFPIKGTSYDKNTSTVNNYYKGVNVLSSTTINFWTEKGHGEWTASTMENFEDNVFPL